MNNSIFGKTMENVRNHSDSKLVTSDKRRKRLVSEPNYHSHKKFSEHLMAIEMKKIRVKMAKQLYLDMSMLDINKTIMYEFWYDYLIQSMEPEQNFVIRILRAFFFTLKPSIFWKIFLMILRNGLIHLIIMEMVKDLFR